MNRNKLKTYAPKARRDFIAAVTARAIKFGISKDAIEPVQVQGNVALIAGQAHPKKVADQRSKLESRTKARGFEQVMEEAAYTWFNRFAAIRYMEVHGYLDHGYRVLSHPEGKATPEIVEHALHLDLLGLDKEKVIELKLDGTKEGDLYRMLLMAQCNALNAAMPFLFERIDDETELLLPDNLLHSDSVIRQMVNEIEEADWQEIEIIGWLYQFYISEKKDQVIGKVVKSEDIPAATQLFTPNWIVKYMVQNTLGAKWLATYPQSGIRAKMEFFIEPAEQTDEVKAKLAAITPKELNPEEITFLDPACGSGHILVEAYDLFKDIYLERGYVLRDVPRLILEKNLFGLDIDDRAAQMAAFALLMKARADDRRVFDRSLSMNVMAIQDSKGLDAGEICRILVPEERCELVPSNDLLPDTLSQPVLADQCNKVASSIHKLIQIFAEGKVCGALVNMDGITAYSVHELELMATKCVYDDIFASSLIYRFMSILRQAKIISTKYDCVAANPPYMGLRAMNNELKAFVRNEYGVGKGDLFSCFILKAVKFSAENAFVSMITMQSWMFLSSFSAFRRDIIASAPIVSMLHVGPRAFQELAGEVVQCVAFSLMKCCDVNYTPVCYRLNDLGREQKSDVSQWVGRNYSVRSNYDFLSFYGAVICYWASNAAFKIYGDLNPISKKYPVRQGMVTSDNARFIRNWVEVPFCCIGFSFESTELAKVSGKKWFPHNKGGEYRRWFGNRREVVNYFNDGEEMKSFHAILDKTNPGGRIKNPEFYFRPCASWSKISGASFSARHFEHGFILDSAGSGVFSDDDDGTLYLTGLLNSSVSAHLISFISPTLNFEVEHIAALPNLSNELESKVTPLVVDIVRKTIAISKQDWDWSEVSWDFKRHPLLLPNIKCGFLADSYASFDAACRRNVSEMNRLESMNNKIFANAYGLGDELVCEHEDSMLVRADACREVGRLISYSIGCMMGRYSLDEPGLIYANSGNVGFDPSRYTTFPADDDGIVPIMQTDWFDDDATNRFVEFLKVAWSPETLTENLKFVADSLGAKSGELPIDTIRRYLSTDFFKDHLKTYKKRPIYWLFSSGKEKAFEALVYLHRYNEGTLSRMRMEYVTPLQGRIASRIDQLGRDIDAAASTTAQNKLRKEQEKLKKQQAELVKFDEELRHYADMRIKLDLDDGVKVNYGKFGNLLAETKAITGGSDE